MIKVYLLPNNKGKNVSSLSFVPSFIFKLRRNNFRYSLKLKNLWLFDFKGSSVKQRGRPAFRVTLWLGMG